MENITIYTKIEFLNLKENLKTSFFDILSSLENKDEFIENIDFEYAEELFLFSNENSFPFKTIEYLVNKVSLIQKDIIVLAKCEDENNDNGTVLFYCGGYMCKFDIVLYDTIKESYKKILDIVCKT